jgi:hypothetical protein
MNHPVSATQSMDLYLPLPIFQTDMFLLTRLLSSIDFAAVSLVTFLQAAAIFGRINLLHAATGL